jgi:hypothetical protein
VPEFFEITTKPTVSPVAEGSTSVPETVPTPMPVEIPIFDSFFAPTEPPNDLNASVVSQPPTADANMTTLLDEYEEATTGNFVISDDDLLNGVVSALNLHDKATSNADWEVSNIGEGAAFDGSYVLKASTMRTILAANANVDTREYHGEAAMTLTIIAGAEGGTLDFALLSKVHFPLDVVEIMVDGKSISSAFGVSEKWEEKSLALNPGKHIITFRHRANPAKLPKTTLDQTEVPQGYEGVSMIDGIRYTDNAVGIVVSTANDVQAQTTVAPTIDDIREACAEGTLSVTGLDGCCVPDPSFLGDGACDPYEPYNTEACGYDLGDCCKDTCNPLATFGCNSKEGMGYGPFGFFCIDPNASSSTIIDPSKCKVLNREWIGDGGCDHELNTVECQWDGGDCCRQSCDPEHAYFMCGREEQPYDCRNPDIINRADYVP